MQRIVWTNKSKQDLLRIHSFLSDKSVVAADKAIRVIQKSSSMLQVLPHIGKPMNDGTERREFVIEFGLSGYSLVYGIEKDILLIISIEHCRERQEVYQ